MHVVLTIAGLSLKFGGPSRSVPALASALANEDVDVDLIACAGHAAENTSISPESARVHLRLMRERARRYQWRARGNDFFSAIAKCVLKNSVIHDNGLWLPTNHAVAVAGEILKRPLLISPRGMLSPWELRHRRWKKSLAWILFQRGDLRRAFALHATSEKEANDFRAVGYRGPVAIVPNGVAIPELSGPRPRSNSPRRAICVTRIHRKKGLLDLIEAWSRVRPPGWRMVIAGSDEDRHRQELEAEIKAKRLTESFEFVGVVESEQRKTLYRGADLFILPSHSENFGMSIAEALAASVPVVTTKGTPWSELNEYQCGWWTDIGAESLAVALKDATQLPDDARSEMGRRGRKLVMEKYSWPNVAKKMKNIYAWVLGRAPQPDCVV